MPRVASLLTVILVVLFAVIRVNAASVACTAADCSSHSTKVTGYRPSCVCTCSSGFAGVICNTCSPSYVSNYPTCSYCSIGGYCNGRATAATIPYSGSTTCQCTCTNYWVGSTCNTCPTSATGTTCSQCAVGYFPAGYAKLCITCSVTYSCESHATSVTLNAAKTGCTCKCRNKWSGTSCGYCNAPYGGPGAPPTTSLTTPRARTAAL